MRVSAVNKKETSLCWLCFSLIISEMNKKDCKVGNVAFDWAPDACARSAQLEGQQVKEEQSEEGSVACCFTHTHTHNTSRFLNARTRNSKKLRTFKNPKTCFSSLFMILTCQFTNFCLALSSGSSNFHKNLILTKALKETQKTCGIVKNGKEMG